MRIYNMNRLTYEETSETSSEANQALDIVIKEGNGERGKDGEQRECDVATGAERAVDAQHHCKVVPQRNSEERTAIGQPNSLKTIEPKVSNSTYKLEVRQTAGTISRKLASRGGVPLSLTKSREYRS